MSGTTIMAAIDYNLVAALKAMRDAGYAQVHGWRDEGLIPGRKNAMTVEGACPCGLGVSRLNLGNDKNMRPTEVYRWVYNEGLAHIEQDRKEGRWRDMWHK